MRHRQKYITGIYLAAVTSLHRDSRRGIFWCMVYISLFVSSVTGNGYCCHLETFRIDGQAFWDDNTKFWTELGHNQDCWWAKKKPRSVGKV